MPKNAKTGTIVGGIIHTHDIDAEQHAILMGYGWEALPCTDGQKLYRRPKYMGKARKVVSAFHAILETSEYIHNQELKQDGNEVMK